MVFKTKDLRVADVRYFDADKMGMEHTEAVSKIILLKRENGYFNLFNIGEECPVYGRLMNTSNTYQNESYGTKIINLAGEVVTGEAWLLTSVDFTKVFSEEFVDIKEIENYVLESPDFYRDRIGIIEKKLSEKGLSHKERKRLQVKLRSDLDSYTKMCNFFADRQGGKIYKK